MPGGHNTAPEGRGALCRDGRLCAAVRGAGALRMRHTPCGCCPPDRAADAVLLSGFTGGSIFYRNTVTVPPAAYFFLSCQKKVCKKEALDAK